MTHGSYGGQRGGQVKIKNRSVVLDKEEGPKFIISFSGPIYGFTLINLCFMDLGPLQT